MTSRRDFLKQSCSACAMVVGFGFLLSQESCSSPATAMSVAAMNGEFSVPLSAFGEKNTLRIREASMRNDVLLVRKPGDQVHAFLMKCTHKGGNIRQQENLLVCNLHGSNFDLDGKVLKEPAKEPLHQFQTRVSGTDIFVRI
ncbi:MAG TPA: Rieske 2Fe-2S domain-containing protein [Bacteroidia bacterium]|nr:Rieske 2Fe-2S domain-containing protein [Bacteroidia bacterium]HNS11501.1 Rieske 2Fe-2S domain-containing protein [Bacteroidia bacterium]